MSIDTTISGSNAPQNWLRRAAAWIADHELWSLLLIVPLVFVAPFVAPSFGFGPALVLIAVTWLARWLAYGWLAPPNPMNAPMLAILLLTVIGYWVAVERYSVNHLWLADTIMRVVVFFAIVNSLRTRQAIIRATSVLLLYFSGSAVLMFLLTNWDNVRLINAPFIYDHIPRSLIWDLSALAPAGVQSEAFMFGSVAIGLVPRLTGDLIASILPLAMALFLFARGRQLRLPAALFLLIGSALLILTQDIPGYLGFLAGAVFIFLWWRPRFTFLSLFVMVVIAIGLVYSNWIALASWVLDSGDLLGIAIVLRLDMWSRALAMIGDMPFTGIGLGTFNLIQSYFYTGYIIGPEWIAHQWFLQAALESGVMGLVAFLWLLTALALTVKHAYQKIDERNLQVLLIGVLACAIAFAVDGFLVSITFGLLWIAWLPYGLAAAVFVLAERRTGDQQDSWAWRAITGWRLLIPFSAVLVLALLLFPTARMRNWGLIQAHQAIYAAIKSGELSDEQAEQATLLLTNSLDREPDRAQLYGTRASLYAWQGDQEAALADLEQRVALDLRDPYGTYAPFVAWKMQVDGEALPGDDESLVHVYQQWSNRLKKRAEFHVLLAMAMERADGDPAQAIKRIELGLEEGAVPRALLETYLQRLVDEGLPAS